MIEFGLPLIISSFVAGVFTFFAPCTLPLVPAFLGIISGVSPEQINNPESLKEVRKKIFVNAVFYVLGFSLIFILFGVAFSALGKILVFRIWIQRIGGIFIILFGLLLLGILRLPFLSREFQIKVPRFFKESNKINSFGIGVVFALGWSPCIGPLLGSILILASNSATLLQGTLLLVLFSLGLSLPFLLTALLVGKAYTSFRRWDKILNVINKVAGVFLVGLGVLLVSGEFTDIFNQLRGLLEGTEFYQEFINRYL